MEIDKVKSEIVYKAVRSSGAGGQNVNKVASKVVLTFDVANSKGFDNTEKELLLLKLEGRLTNDNLFILNCDEERSQFRNKDLVSKRFFEILKKALFVAKKRKTTKIPKSVIVKRINAKRAHAERKTNRKKPDFNSFLRDQM